MFSPASFAKKVARRLSAAVSAPKMLRIEDAALISDLKTKYEHGVREFRHRTTLYSVDCLYCHAVPGTFESSLLVLWELGKLQDGNNLLNLGGGTGQVSNIVSELGFRVINVEKEISNPSVDNIAIDLNEPGALPITPGSFDFVFCQEVIEHLENPWDLFRKARTVLKEGGSMVLTTPNVQSTWSKRLFSRTNHFPWFTPDCWSYHINAVPLWEIELIGNRTGFKVWGVTGNGDYYFHRSSNSTKKTLDESEALIVVFKATGDVG